MHIIRITPQLVGWVAERERGGRREGGGKKGGREGREGGREGREGEEGGRERKSERGAIKNESILLVVFIEGKSPE